MAIIVKNHICGLFILGACLLIVMSSCNSSDDLSGDYTFSGKGGGQDYIYHTMSGQNGKMLILLAQVLSDAADIFCL